MKRIVAAFIVLLAIAACAPKANWAPADANPEGVYPDEVWQKATTPEELGWSSEKLAAARAYSERIGSAAVMIVDNWWCWYSDLSDCWPTCFPIGSHSERPTLPYR